MMPFRWRSAALVACAALVLTGCPKGNADYKAGKKAEAIRDWDTALLHYQRALQDDPVNPEYKLKMQRVRFEAGMYHVRLGQKHGELGELQLAMTEFEKALAIDPSSAIARQELQGTLEAIAGKNAATNGNPPPAAQPPPYADLLAAPPELKPLNRDPIDLKMTNDARILFETIGKLAGLTVVFDPDFASRRISVEFNRVTLEQALEVLSLQSKAFWKPLAENIIFVAPDQQQKRRDYEEMVVRTFYLGNTVQPQDLTEIVTGLRSLFDLKRIQQVNSQNAIVIRDTPDKIAQIEKVIKGLDKAKPEVVIQVSIMQARRDRMRDLGILPGSTATLAFTPRNPTGGTSGSSTTTTNQIPLNELQRLASADYSVTLPGAALTALMSDSQTRILQNPEIRSVDGQPAKLRVGDRVPVATGSFQAGVGVGGATGTGIVNPLVNTQFQFIDVGVNIDVTPRIHPNSEISMKVSAEVSSVASRVTIGGIEQPIIAQRKIEHDIRLREGEVNILAGLVERTKTKSKQGWPGLGSIPVFGRLFSDQKDEEVESEVLIVLTPRLVRKLSITAEDLKSIASGTDVNFEVRRQTAPTTAPTPAPEQPAPPGAPPQQPPQAGQQPMFGTQGSGAPEGAPGVPRVRFDPAVINLQPGQTVTVALVIENVKDLYSIPLLLKYDPQVISIEDVQHGGFLSGGTQDVAIVHRVDAANGQAIISATRQPNTPGVNGTGTLVGIVVKGVAPGTSRVSVLQVNAKDSQQQPIQLVSGETTIRVQQ